MFELFEMLFEAHALLTVVLKGDSFQSVFVLAFLDQKDCAECPLTYLLDESVATEQN
jgi:hypothetical protein